MQLSRRLDQAAMDVAASRQAAETATAQASHGATDATDQKHVSVKARVPQFPMFNLCFEAHISTLFTKG